MYIFFSDLQYGLMFCRYITFSDMFKITAFLISYLNYKMQLKIFEINLLSNELFFRFY